MSEDQETEEMGYAESFCGLMGMASPIPAAFVSIVSYVMYEMGGAVMDSPEDIGLGIGAGFLAGLVTAPLLYVGLDVVYRKFPDRSVEIMKSIIDTGADIGRAIGRPVDRAVDKLFNKQKQTPKP